MPKNNQISNINIYKPTGKGTLISELIKKNDNDETSIKNEHDNKYKGIKKLANDVNISLQELENIEKKRKNKKYKKILEYTEPFYEPEYNDTQNEDTINVDTINVDTVEFYNDYVNIFIEMLLLLTVYVVMSQHFVIDNMAKYIYLLYPSKDGTIGLSGIIIYGMIMTCLFIVIRHLVLKKIK
jgi:hypothetical protein